MQKILKVILSSNSFVKFKLYSNIIQISNFVQTPFNALLIELSKTSDTVQKSNFVQTMFKYIFIHNLYKLSCLQKKAKYYNALLVQNKVYLQK